eukprot:scaffold330_cov246-Pinguiococcus_pyrenoidosus.AAC.15
MASSSGSGTGEAAIRKEFHIKDPEEAVAPDQLEARRALLAKLQQQTPGKGAKKRRRDDRPPRNERLCTRMATDGQCPYERCKFSHDLKKFLAAKPPDLGATCHLFDTYGFCRAGLSCRFGSSHLEAESGANVRKEDWSAPPEEQNELDMGVAAALRKNIYPFYRPRKDGRNAQKEIKARNEEGLPVLEREEARPGHEHRDEAVAELEGEESKTAPALQKDEVPASSESAQNGQAETRHPVAEEPAGGAASQPAVEASNGQKAETAETADGDRASQPAVEASNDQKAETAETADGDRRSNATESALPPANGTPVVEMSSGEDPGSEPQATGAKRHKTADGGVRRTGVPTSEAASEGRRPSDARLPTACSSEDMKMEAYPTQPRKLIDFREKVYVAPLTTVGNLPYRRIMKGLGADITCGEMALATNLLSGSRAEWSLMRRAPEEDVFGVQLAGAHRDQMARAAELLRAQIDVDFIDVNLGCPIDVVTDKGAGSALMQRPHRVSGIVKGMGEALWWDDPKPYSGRLAHASEPTRRVQLTVKMRMGWLDDHPCAPSIVRRVQSAANHIGGGAFGPVAAVMIHGRSRLQRYTRAANWEYVASVAATAQDPTMPRIPVIGNGDLVSFEEWEAHKAAFARFRESDAETERVGAYESSSKEGPSENPDDPEEVAEKKYGIETCAMLARGALIKPWLPVELKERRHWDISAQERLDILRTFTNFGLEHWGSDDIGVNSTRRFLLEWLSFTHRYIPVGLLERLPQRIQERPPRYKGEHVSRSAWSLFPADVADNRGGEQAATSWNPCWHRIKRWIGCGSVRCSLVRSQKASGATCTTSGYQLHGLTRCF